MEHLKRTLIVVKRVMLLLKIYRKCSEMFGNVTGDHSADDSLFKTGPKNGRKLFQIVRV